MKVRIREFILMGWTCVEIRKTVDRSGETRESDESEGMQKRRKRC